MYIPTHVLRCSYDLITNFDRTNYPVLALDPEYLGIEFIPHYSSNPQSSPLLLDLTSTAVVKPILSDLERLPSLTPHPVESSVKVGGLRIEDLGASIAFEDDVSFLSI
jgi:hypothetical protein